MRGLQSPFAFALLAHALVLAVASALLGQRRPSARPAERAPVTIEVIAAAAPPPAPETPAASRPPAAPVPARRSAATIARSSTPAPAAPPVGDAVPAMTAEPSAGRAPELARTPAPPSLSPLSTQELLDRVRPAEPRPFDPLALPALPAIPGPRVARLDHSRLQPAGGGTARENDLTFRARIDRDGKVHIAEKGSIDLGAATPTLSRYGKTIDNHLERDGADEQAPPDPDRSDQGTVVFVLSIPLDLTGAIMRMLGEDPYQARKRVFLERTFDERAQMRVTNQVEDLRDVIGALRGELARIWGDTRRSAAERRALLFALWDDCLEPGAEVAGDAATAAAVTARATIIGFIRTQLPSDDPDGYSAAELADLNERRSSKQPFEPYLSR
jgi:hypothetical protein